MRSRSLVQLLFIVSVCTFSLAQTNHTADVPVSGAAESGYVPVLKFDPNRDAAADIRAAMAEAQRTGKRVLLDVGGDWCAWCHVFDKFFAQHPDIAHLRDENFITVPIFYSHENKNEKVLSTYPQIEGIPQFLVLQNDGKLLYSQAAVKLETGGEPDPEKIKDFLLKWSIDRSTAGSSP